MTDMRRALLTSYTDIREERVAWLWPLRIPLGAVTLLAGQPGLGKSQLSLALAARLTRGELPCGLGTAVIATAEDHRAAVIRPRLRAAQADLAAIFDIRVHRLDDGSEDGIVLPVDVAELEAAVQQVEARLVILDPLVSFLDGRVDSWKDASVRQALSPLAGLAERQDCAVLGIVHVNKSLSGDPFQRIGGSVGFQGAPRSVLVLGRDPDDADRRVLIHSKSNYGREAPSLLLALDPILLPPAADGAPPIETSRVTELGETDHTAESVLGPALGDEERIGVTEAEDFLRDVLAFGPVDAAQVKRDAKAAGISERTLDRAKAALGIRMPQYVKRVGGVGGQGHWTWELPKPARPNNAEVISPSGALSENPHEQTDSAETEPLRTPPTSNGTLSAEIDWDALGTARLDTLRERYGA